MRYKKHSHFKLYIVSTLIAFFLPTIISISIVIVNKQKYLDNIIEYINKSSPVNVYIEDINISYKLYIVLDNIKLYSKNNNKNNFFFLDKASIRINPLRLIKNRNIINLISDININSAYFYPVYFDRSILNIDTGNSSSITANEFREIIKIISTSLYDKRVHINNFISEIKDNNDRKTIVSLDEFTANFQTKKYFINYSINIPDDTTIKFLIESDTNISNLKSTIKGYDNNRNLFEYDINITNDFNTATANIYRDTDNSEIFNALYTYSDNKLNFEAIDLNIDKDAISKILNIVLDTPIIYNVIKLDNQIIQTISNTVNSFQYATINFSGEYSKEKDLSLDFNLKARDKLFFAVLDAYLTNNNIVLSNAMIELFNGNIIANASIPTTNIYASRANLNIRNIELGDNKLSSRMSLRPLRNNDNEYSSLFTIHTLSYLNSLQNQLAWNIRYNKKDKNIKINQIVNLYDNPLKIDISLDKTTPIIAKASGDIPQEIFIVALGQNPIDNLSSLNINYTMSNEMYTSGKGHIHSIDVASKKIYTEEYLMKLSADIYNNKIDINNVYYKLSDKDEINAKANIDYDNKFNVKMSGDIITPVGDYKVNGFTIKNQDNISLYVNTENEELEVKGNIQTNGIFNINIKTPKELKYQDIIFSANIDINNQNNKPIYVHGDIKANKTISPVFTLNTQFELTNNNNIMFTNIILDYGDNRVVGEGKLNVSDGINKFNAALRDIDNDGVLVIDASINKDNIYGKMTALDLPFNFTIGGGLYGILSANTTIIGSFNSPVVYLDNLNIKDFEVIGERYNIELSGVYKKDELELKNVLMTKTGANGFSISNPLKKPQQVKIEKAYFSKDLHNMEIEVNDLFFLSTFNGKISYNMRSLADGRSEYRINTTPIKVNKRTLPAFGTLITKNTNDSIEFKNTKPHGINGKIYKEDRNTIADLVYKYDYYDILNISGDINKNRKEDVDILLTSSKLNVEVFEIFNTLFTEIQSSPTNFIVNDKPYTLYAKLHGDLDDLAITGRFLGHGRKVKMIYFSDVFDETIVDLNFEGHDFNINNLSFTYRGKKNLTISGNAELFKNKINYMSFDLLSSDEQLGLLNGDIDLTLLKIKGPLHVDITVGGNLESPRIGGILTLMKSDVQLGFANQSTYKQHVYGLISKVYWDFLIEAWQQVRVTHNLVGDVYLEEGAKMQVFNTLENGLELAGTIEFNRGNIYYLQNIYQIENGNVTFPTVNSVDPIITATAFSYKKYYPSTTSINNANSFENNSAGESVTLYMEMDARLSQLLTPDNSGITPVKFYTVPALGQYHVNQLAGIPQGTFGNRDNQAYVESTSTLNNSINQEQSQQLILNYSDLILRSTVLRPVERWVRQFLDIDYITLNPTVVNNLIFSNNNSLTAASVWDNTSVGIGKYVSKYLYIKYDVTYRVNDPSIPNILGKPADAYYFDHQFGFEVSLLKNYKLANFVFEYKINPFNIIETGQEFNIVTRWRF